MAMMACFDRSMQAKFWLRLGTDAAIDRPICRPVCKVVTDKMARGAVCRRITVVGMKTANRPR